MAEMTFWVLVTGSFWLLLAAGPELGKVAWLRLPVELWLGVAYLSIFTTIVTFFLTQFSVIHLGPTKVMAYSYLYPTLVIIIELALGRGLPPASTIPGVLVVLAAMFVLQAGKEAG